VYKRPFCSNLFGVVVLLDIDVRNGFSVVKYPYMAFFGSRDAFCVAVNAILSECSQIVPRRTYFVAKSQAGKTLRILENILRTASKLLHYSTNKSSKKSAKHYFWGSLIR